MKIKIGQKQIQKQDILNSEKTSIAQTQTSIDDVNIDAAELFAERRRLFAQIAPLLTRMQEIDHLLLTKNSISRDDNTPSSSV